MNKPLAKKALLVFIIAVSVWLVVRYVYVLREQISTLEAQRQNLLQDLEKEKNNLLLLRAQYAGLKEYTKAVHKRLRRSFAELDTIEDRIEQLNLQINLLKAENTELSRGRLGIETQAKDQKPIIQNSGYLIKDSQASAPSNVKIEVTPISPAQQ